MLGYQRESKIVRGLARIEVSLITNYWLPTWEQLTCAVSWYSWPSLPNLMSSNKTNHFCQDWCGHGSKKSSN